MQSVWAGLGDRREEGAMLSRHWQVRLFSCTVTVKYSYCYSLFSVSFALFVVVGENPWTVRYRSAHWLFRFSLFPFGSCSLLGLFSRALLCGVWNLAVGCGAMLVNHQQLKKKIVRWSVSHRAAMIPCMAMTLWAIPLSLLISFVPYYYFFALSHQDLHTWVGIHRVPLLVFLWPYVLFN